MSRNLIYLALAALIIWAIVAGIQHFFHSQPAKDRTLASVTYEEMRLNSDLKDNLVSFKLIEPTKYRCETKGLNDAHAAGRFAYNAMVVLLYRNDAIVKTGRTEFTIYGYQDRELIFEVHYSNIMPEVTLKGRFEGIEYVPTFGALPATPRFERRLPESPVPTVYRRLNLA
jgi:hypothetical protein